MDSATQFGNTRDTGSSAESGRQQSAGESQQSLADQLRQQASSRLAGQKDRAVQGLTSLADAVRQTGQQLREKDQTGIATYLESAADQAARFSQRLGNKDLGEIVEDVQRFAHRQPALFLGVSFGIGLLGARFLKSSRSGDGGSSHPNPAWRRSYPMASSAATGAGYSGNPMPTPRTAITPPPPTAPMRAPDAGQTSGTDFGAATRNDRDDAATRFNDADDAVGAASADVRRGTSGPRTARRTRSEQ